MEGRIAFRERKFNFSLKFPVSQEVKLLPTTRATREHRFMKFRQLWEVGVFSYSVYFGLKSH